MNRYRYNYRNYWNRSNNNYNYNNQYHYNYYSYDSRDRFPKVARLPNKYLRIISQESGSYINPGVYDPNKGNGFSKINCHASFDCHRCGNMWTSNKVTVELWWKNGKRIFDVRMYGQKCKRCNGDYIRPFISGIEDVVNKCIKILISPSKKREMNANKNTNRNFNNSHDQQRCQKCQMIGGPCW